MIRRSNVQLGRVGRLVHLVHLGNLHRTRNECNRTRVEGRKEGGHFTAHGRVKIFKTGVRETSNI